MTILDQLREAAEALADTPLPDRNMTLLLHGTTIDEAAAIVAALPGVESRYTTQSVELKLTEKVDLSLYPHLPKPAATPEKPVMSEMEKAIRGKMAALKFIELPAEPQVQPATPPRGITTPHPHSFGARFDGEAGVKSNG